MLIEEIICIPFVISNIPVINGEINIVGMCINLKNGESIKTNIFNILLEFKIEIKTENRTIKPPIIKIEFTELTIELESNVIKFDLLIVL